MNTFARLPADTTAAASQPIPYRTEPPITAGQALSVFAITVALLAMAVGTLLWARKRGWLQRWSVAAHDEGLNRNALRILGQTRLGHASHAYVIEADGTRFVVVESSRQVSLHALPKNTTPGNGHG